MLIDLNVKGKKERDFKNITQENMSKTLEKVKTF